MMQLINNEHQWAFILAHENSHLELNHYILRLKKFEKPGVFFTKTRLNRFMIQQEDEADEWASNYLEQNGFDESQIYYFLNRVLMTQEVDHSGNHKKLKKRIKKISSPEIIDSGFKNLINSL
jgi:predicted Zn-dependent protease